VADRRYVILLSFFFLGTCFGNAGMKQEEEGMGSLKTQLQQSWDVV